ncbi:MFS transporter [Achromobacter sp. Marseille-Q0513]|uniref:MFS transporter n=1 Tax=Achromobacter sp. Marseille-Q0513 TaxID=2829161 RepID=UPI001B9B9771|nr:MFS transporter [Achromobacter sp. Marseille-Q0513]MBR8654515.1 MFS transporter [Achromobacter sp. Marseille-Q0513]
MPPSTHTAPDGAQLSAFALTARIVAIAFFTFICYLAIGLPLAVLPGYVHGQLGYGSVLAGLAISVQYAATLLSRSHAGRMADTVGPKQTAVVGMAACAASGVFLLLAYAFERSAWLSLSAIIASRLALGFGESWVGTGAATWAIARVGPIHTARVISWNGICTYGGLALGAPLGVYLEKEWSMGALGGAVLLLGLAGLGLALARKAVAVVGGHRMAFKSVVLRVFPHGMALGLGSVGFGTLAAFVALYYASRSWEGAAHALSAFGCAFIGVRLLFAGTITRYGGFRVAQVSFLVEAAGLALLWLAPSAGLALMGAALTGCGFALVFPAIGVEAVARVPAGSRGAALGAYSAFLDLALGVTGPVAGYISGGFGYPAIFLSAALAVLVGFGIATGLYRHAARQARAAAGNI